MRLNDGRIVIVLGLLLVLTLALAFFLLRGMPTAPPRADRPASPAPASPVPDSPAAAAWYDIYFTTPTYPDRPENRRGGIDERLVAYIDSATRTLDVAVYDFDLENVAQAMARARGRGVAVRMVTDSDTINNTRDEQIQRALTLVRDAGITIVGDERSAIMHHKFAVRDGEEVWTGSWNFTTGDTYRLNNHAVRIRSPELARVYAGEFEAMFANRQFGGGRVKRPPPPPIQIEGVRVQPMFAPENNVADQITERVRAARTGIHFLAFSFTHDGIGQAVIERARAGVSVSGVFERTGSETRFSEFGTMRQAGLDVYQDGNPYVMHHKVFVLDGRTTVLGSFNFSEGADRDNDENVLIVDDPAFAGRFEEEFQQMLSLAKSAPPRQATPERERPR